MQHDGYSGAKVGEVGTTWIDEDRARSRSRLWTEQTLGQPPSDAKPDRLALIEIIIKPVAFQMREGQAIVQEWVGDLLKLLRGGIKQPDPIMVWWTGARWVVLDGHLRFESYR